MDWIKAMVMKRRYQEEIAKLNATDNEEIHSLYEKLRNASVVTAKVFLVK